MAAIAGGLLTAPLAAEAQPTGKVHRLGLLTGGSASLPNVEGFRQALRELGWVEGQNIVIEHRFAEGRVERLPDLAAELIRLKVDVIAAGPTPPAVAAKKATATIPIVMLGAAEPVDLGLIESFTNPGGNVTGLSWSPSLELLGKGLELLREMAPKIRLVAVLWNSANPAQGLAISDVKRAARSLDVQLQLLEVRGPNDFEAAFAAMAKRRAEAVLVVADALFVFHGVQLAKLAARYRLPSIHSFRQNVETGGLMSYGPDTVAVWRRAALFVDKILKGRKPADLPVEQLTKFELVINLKTAKALGLTIPPSLLGRADEVIQ